MSTSFQARPDRRFEYLDPDQLFGTPEFKTVEHFLQAAGHTRIGWHYIVDLTWIYRQAMRWAAGTRVLDCGGGSGPAQFMLAELGFDVTNVDLMKVVPRVEQEHRYRIVASRLNSWRSSSYAEHLKSVYGTPAVADTPRRTLWRRFARALRPSALLRIERYRRAMDAWQRVRDPSVRPRPGTIHLIEGNLAAMPELADGQFDAVVSLSALEHLPFDALRAALAEISRVLRPGAHWAVTTSGTDRLSSWFHEPSRGWCFGADDLKAFFHAQPAPGQDAGRVLQHYRACVYLQDNLADFYRTSGQNGMPWGRWDPQYVPVGITDSAEDAALP